MAEIKIHREHRLGLAKARKIAWQWAEEVEADLQMECTVIEGDGSDTVEFVRAGVSGRLVVAADHFDLHARLGLLVGAFSKSIEAEIVKNLDAKLGAAGAAPVRTAAGRKPPAKGGRKAT